MPRIKFARVAELADLFRVKYAAVVELADTHDSKSCAERHGSSTLPLGTKPKSFVLVYLYNHARTYFSKNL